MCLAVCLSTYDYILAAAACLWACVGFAQKVRLHKAEVERFSYRVAQFGAIVCRLLMETGTTTHVPEGLGRFQSLLSESKAAVDVRPDLFGFD